MLLVLLMGRRTRKMSFNTYLMVFAYWFIIAVECGSLLEMLLISDVDKHVIFTTEAITCIAMIASNTYAIVTLCSYINPRGFIDKANMKNKFHFVYIVLVCGCGILFAEIPMLVTRMRLMTSMPHSLPGSFYLWLIKDIVFIGLILVLGYVQRFGQKYLRLPFKPSVNSSKHVFFQPEKRDRYINQLRTAMYHQTRREAMCSNNNEVSDSSNSLIPKCKSVPDMSARHLYDNSSLTASKSTTHLDQMNKLPAPESNFFVKFTSHFTTSKLTNVQQSKEHSAAASKKAKRVSFKVELGGGRFLSVKARSDSPPVYHNTGDVTVVTIPTCESG